MQKRGFVAVYSIFLILFSLASVAHDAFILLKNSKPIFSTIILFAGVSLFLFSLITLAILHHHNYPKLYYFAPIYFLISYVLFFGLGLLLRNVITAHLQAFVFISVGSAIVLFILSISMMLKITHKVA